MKVETYLVVHYMRTLKLTDKQLRRRHDRCRDNADDLKHTAVRWTLNRAERAGLVPNVHASVVELERDFSLRATLIHVLVSAFRCADPEAATLLRHAAPPLRSAQQVARLEPVVGDSIPRIARTG